MTGHFVNFGASSNQPKEPALKESRALIASLETDLRKSIAGDVLFDDVNRWLYSTDASLYEIRPVGVVVPRNRSDISESIRIAAEHGVSILPRGGGTSLAGQTVGASLVLDCSKYMNRMLELNEDERWVRVQPGLVRDELNSAIRFTGLHFAPDVATSSRANIGGMIGNNSSGTHSIVHGKTVDQVLDLRAVLSNGEEVLFEPLGPDAWNEKCRLETLEGRIYRELDSILSEHSDEIRAKFPKVMRRVGGYNLDELLDPNERNLAKLITGSEGTLACITDARLKLEPLPRHTAMLIVHFSGLIESLRAVVPILKLRPAAVELLDRIIIDLARQNLQSKKTMSFLEDEPDALLLIEFFGDSADEVKNKIAETETVLRSQNLGFAFVAMTSPEEQQNIWEMRKAGLGIMLSMRGDAKPMPFIEDACVPPEHLADYIEKVIEIVHRHKRTVSMYAHASVGVLHVRPILNLKKPADVRILKNISDEVFDLVVGYGGSWSGEHGDGLVRSAYNERFFGPVLYETFKRIKKVFDPENRFNPGKIVDAQDMRENLRIHPEYQTESVSTFFRFEQDGGIAAAAEMCSGVGACRKTLTGTMCPSYMVTRDEIHSTRGRANALRAALSGKIGAKNLADEKLYPVFDLCLGCKGCKTECPSNVDVAKLKYEFLAHYYEAHGTPLSVRLGSRPDALGRLGSRLPAVLNRLIRLPGIAGLMGFDPRRRLPSFPHQRFEDWFSRRRPTSGLPDDRPRVALFNDTFMNYYEPGIGTAAVRVLESRGFAVEVLNIGCCRRPQISSGLLAKARPASEALVEALFPYAGKHIPVLGCEPSCVSAIKDDYLDFVRNGDKASAVAENFHLIDDFINTAPAKKTPGRKACGAAGMVYHGHCHMKALFGTAGSRAVLEEVSGGPVIEVDSGCCGMAGAFGYEKKHYAISEQIGDRRLFPAVRANPEAVVVANGFSCRHQIEHFTGRRARHTIEILAEALGPES